MNAQQSQLKNLFDRYTEVDAKYQASIYFNHNGTKVAFESKGLKGASTRAYNRFYDFAKSIGMTTQDIINYSSPTKNTI